MVHDRSERHGFVKGECLGCDPGDEHLTWKTCHRYWLSQLYEGLGGCRSACDKFCNLRGIKEKLNKKWKQFFMFFVLL